MSQFRCEKSAFKDMNIKCVSVISLITDKKLDTKPSILSINETGRGQIGELSIDLFVCSKGTIITLSIGTPYLLTIILLKFEIVHSTTC